jgi:hypothetical protein
VLNAGWCRRLREDGQDRIGEIARRMHELCRKLAKS